MENEIIEQRADYSFLVDERVEKYFADLNVKLLSGRHIQIDEYNSFSLLEDWFDPIYEYYNRLYKLELTKDNFDQTTYYYLNFFTSGKGKLSDPARNRELTELQTIVGLILLDMYYVKYFDDPKIVSWNDIKRELEEGENKESYQRIFLGSLRPSYTETEWLSVERKFKLTINSFAELGWVVKRSGQQEELMFEIKPAIHRMARLYERELKNFSEFSQQVRAKQDAE